MRLIDADAIPDIEFLVCDATSANGELDAYCRGMDKVMEVVKSMPTIEVPQWIPCSERLPEVGTYVLISKKALGFRSNLPSVCTAHRTHDPRSGKEEWNDMLFGKLNDDDVLAWMSLPEPYEERRTE